MMTTQEKLDRALDALAETWSNAEEAVKEGEAKALCFPSMALYRLASRGWQPEWHQDGHREDCQYCRRMARIAFRAHRPGIWITKDASGLPTWWQQAVADHLAENPTLWSQIQDWLSRGASAAISPLIHADVSTGLVRGAMEPTSATDPDDGDFYTTLAPVARNGRTVWEITVHDDDTSRLDREGKWVLVGLMGAHGTLLRRVQLEKMKGRLKLVGRIDIPEADVMALGEPKLLPPKLLTPEEIEELGLDAEDDTETADTEA